MSLEAVWDLRIRTGAGASTAASTASTSSSISTLTPSSTTSDQNQQHQEQHINLLPYSPRCACVFAAPNPPPPLAANDPTTTTTNNEDSTNPFDDAAATATTTTNSNSAGVASNRPPPPTPRAIVFGSEQGSLHYRCYPSPLFTGDDDGGGDAEKGSFGNMSSSPNRNKKVGRSNNHNNNTAHVNVNVPRPALGVTPSGRSPGNVSRIYFPVDLPPKSLPGPVI